MGALFGPWYQLSFFRILEIMLTDTRRNYIDTIAPAAKAACEGTGLFPSLCIAQAILESGEGQSALSQMYNNHFGIKADSSWKGKIGEMTTREVYNGKSVMVQAKFRSYDTVEAGIADRCQFLKENPRYFKAGVFTAKTPEDQARAFQKAGYATDPNYAALLISVINGSGQLKQYD
jgi:flagellum-specific peptidoglycan hydrolase FlgJ